MTEELQKEIVEEILLLLKKHSLLIAEAEAVLAGVQHGLHWSPVDTVPPSERMLPWEKASKEISKRYAEMAREMFERVKADDNTN